VALVLDPEILLERTVGERDVVVGNIVEEVNLILLKEETGGNGMHRSITPSFVEEPTVFVKVGEEIDVGLRTKPVEVTDFKVGPLYTCELETPLSNMSTTTYEVTIVISITTVVTEPAHGIALNNVLGVLLHETLCTFPKGRNSLLVLEQTEYETILLLVVCHELEWVVIDVAVKVDAWLHAPVPLVLIHQGLTEEESRLEATHVAVADGITVDDFLLSHFLSY